MRPKMVEELGHAAVELLLAPAHAARKDSEVRVLQLRLHKMKNVVILGLGHDSTISKLTGVEVRARDNFEYPAWLDLEGASKVGNEPLWQHLASDLKVGNARELLHYDVESTSLQAVGLISCSGSLFVLYIPISIR